MLLTVILGTLALVSFILNLWQWWLAAGFPLHRRIPGATSVLGVTLLKPLKGCDAETVACLRSWLEQDLAGSVQVLFGVASDQDPVCALVQQLMAEHPRLDARLIVCPEMLGPNAKVSTLVQLEAHACHDILVVSDADVWVPADLLTHLTAPLRETQTGLVCSFYRMANARGFGMRWEALGVNADFWSSVLQARSLKPLDFALGAVMATTRQRLAAIGGFRSLVEQLADDYQLGHRIASAGGQIALCPVVVECRSAPLNWRQVWSHQVRWARTIRVCQPAPYFLSILSNATLWPLLWLALRPSAMSAAAWLVCLVARLAAARYCEAKLVRPAPARDWPLAPLKDLLQVVVWAMAFTGNHVEWRGKTFRVMSGGKLVAAGGS